MKVLVFVLGIIGDAYALWLKKGYIIYASDLDEEAINALIMLKNIHILMMGS